MINKDVVIEVTIIESKRSKMPPCDFNIVPKSLILKVLLIEENNKSPKVAERGIMMEIIKILYQCSKSKTPSKSGCPKQDKSIPNPNEIIKEIITPPTKPSIVFLGEILGQNLCFPNKTPIKNAPTSLKHVPSKKYKINNDEVKYLNIGSTSTVFDTFKNGKNLK